MNVKSVKDAAQFLNVLSENNQLAVMEVKLDGVECVAIAKTNILNNMVQDKDDPAEVSLLAVLMNDNLYEKIFEQNKDVFERMNNG